VQKLADGGVYSSGRLVCIIIVDNNADLYAKSKSIYYFF
jgi:hypothetical protein